MEALEPHFFITTDMNWWSPPPRLRSLLTKVDAALGPKKDRTWEEDAEVAKHLAFIDKHYFTAHDERRVS